METDDYLKLLVERIHSAAVATIGSDGHPQIRTIDMMLCDEKGVYFLTARGKAFYSQLTEQRFVAVSATKDKFSVSLRGKAENIGNEKLEEIFVRNPYMASIYPGGTRSALEVFRIYDAVGEYFDISDPSHVIRDDFIIGNPEHGKSGYFVGSGCDGCGVCLSVCPQRCIDISSVPAVIEQNRCLRCGRCMEVCPNKAISRC